MRINTIHSPFLRIIRVGYAHSLIMSVKGKMVPAFTLFIKRKTISVIKIEYKDMRVRLSDYFIRVSHTRPHTLII